MGSSGDVMWDVSSSFVFLTCASHFRSLPCQNTFADLSMSLDQRATAEYNDSSGRVLRMRIVNESADIAQDASSNNALTFDRHCDQAAHLPIT